MTKHPHINENGQGVTISNPSIPTSLDAWADSDLGATVIPAGDMPAAVNGIAVASWAEPPQSSTAWITVAGQLPELAEPAWNVPAGMKASAGAVIIEDDGRVWLIAPTNAFGGYKASFPKGTIENGSSLQATAIKEVYEESGLRIEITGFLCDTVRSTSVARYYLAKRLGGNPADMGWESQAVHLVPVEQLHTYLNNGNDAPIINAIKQHLQQQELAH